MAIADLDLHRWTREEYERLAEAGFFPPQSRLELIDGLIYHVSPQSSFHSTVVLAAHDRLREVIAAGCHVRVQMPLALGDDSEPEPDLAVVSGSLTDYAFAHPTGATLVVEVADSSLLHDRRRKVPLYARAGIPEVWLLVIPRREVEVYREPVDGQYGSSTVLRREASVSPLAQPDAWLPVAAFFPWASPAEARRQS